MPVLFITFKYKIYTSSQTNVYMIKQNRPFKTSKTVIGMVHVGALPGTPNYEGNPRRIIQKAINEALIYKDAGVDAVMIENMHDTPYMKNKAGAEITAMMSVIGYQIKQKTGLPVGIQILAGANKEALACALAGNLDFIRAEGFVFGHLADEGYIDACAGELLRYRKAIEANHILIFTDIKKKHSSHAISADIDILETAKAAVFFLSDGLIITGSSTGEVADIDEIKIVYNKTNLPVLIGSGITIDNIESYFYIADAFIVGSHFKIGGNWINEVDKMRVDKFMNKIKLLKESLKK